MLETLAQIGVFVRLAGSVQRLFDSHIRVLGAIDHALSTASKFIGNVMEIAILIHKNPWSLMFGGVMHQGHPHEKGKRWFCRRCAWESAIFRAFLGCGDWHLFRQWSNVPR
ncbi:MAG: hypothetical protein DDT34_01683 [Firmicutes bacterium]|nr:hypothetical protein [Bacillota bacterium]